MNPRHLSLIRAVTDDDTEAVRTLVAAGSDVNKPTSGGQTPLIIAVVFRRIKILSLLLQAGADPQLHDDLGLNALDWAERKGFAEGVKLLTQNKTSRQGTGPDTSTTKPQFPNSLEPNQIEKLNSPVSKESTHVAGSDEKSRRWIAGMKRRIAEEASHKVKEVQPTLGPPRTEKKAPLENEPARINVNAPSVCPTVSKPEVITSPPDRVTNVASNTEQLKDQIHAAQTKTEVVPRDDARSQPPSSTIGPTSTSFSRKRCPKCNAVYNSGLLAYCAIHMTPLVDASTPAITSPPDKTITPMVWFLVVFTFVVASGVTTMMIPNWKSLQNTAPAAVPTPAANVAEPLVAGDLIGKQLHLPTPEYPMSARSENVFGTVKVRVTVDQKGNVIAVKVIEGDRRLRNAAIAAAAKATFSPEKLTARGAVGTITYTFKV